MKRQFAALAHNPVLEWPAKRPIEVRTMRKCDRDALIVSSVHVDGQWHARSVYGDMVWILNTRATLRSPAAGRIDFGRLPPKYVAVAKNILYLYLHNGRDGSGPRAPSTVVAFFAGIVRFLRFLDGKGIYKLSDAKPLACKMYVDDLTQAVNPCRGKQPLASRTLTMYFGAVELIYKLSQRTADPMAAPPWRGTTSHRLSTMDDVQRAVGRTPVIPDEHFTKIFQLAWQCVQDSVKVLDLRDGLQALCTAPPRYTLATGGDHAAIAHLESCGWVGGLEGLDHALIEVRTACYIVVASLSGCRVHELAFVENGACFQTEDDSGETYWWMRSRTTKSVEGPQQWLIPQAAVDALQVMERWAAPYQAMLAEEIRARRSKDPADLEIAEAKRHQSALFLGIDAGTANIRTLGNGAWNVRLKDFARRRGVPWNLATHQFRSTFAHYAARSRFGDLRYLKEHFKHWSMDVTLGYAIRESKELTIYLEVEEALDEIKAEVVGNWLSPEEPLGGGYGRSLMQWRAGEPISIFRSHDAMVRSVSLSTAIRSNGHAWCTAGDAACVGNDLERTRCSGCNNAVIDRRFTPIYQDMYSRLQGLLDCNDIGEAGLQRVQRDLSRCREVLESLGFRPEGT